MSEQRDGSERNSVSLRHYYDIGMGIIYLGLATYIYKLPHKDQYVLKDGLYIFATMFGIFGFFRLVRGIYVMIKSMKRK